MVSTSAEAIIEIERLRKKLKTQRDDADKWGDYYEGKQPLTFSSPEWRKWFGSQYENFADNWCAPVVNATAERQRFIGFALAGESRADSDLARVVAENNADAGYALAAVEAQYARRAFASVWPNPKDPKTPFIEYESATEVVLECDPGMRRRRRLALKLWHDESEEFATLYTPTHLWKFRRRLFSPGGLVLPTGLMAWEPREVPGEVWPLPNPLGEVPIEEIPNQTTLTREPMSAIRGVAAMQDAINLLWAHLFTASDFAALPQRVILSAELPKIPILDEHGQPTGNFKPLDLPEANIRRILTFDGPNAKIAEWDAASLDQFLKVIEKAVGHISDQTRTPAYYFSATGSISNISGDTVKALDAGLVQKVRSLCEIQGRAMRNVAVLVCKAMEDEDKAKAMSSGATLWADPEIRSEAQMADALQKYAAIGFPFEWIAAQKISDPQELASVIEAYYRQKQDPSIDHMLRTLSGPDADATVDAAPEDEDTEA